MIQTLNIPFAISGTKITLPFSAVCTVTDKPFGGEVVVQYVPVGKVLEYVDVEAFVGGVCNSKRTAEELAHVVFTEVESSLKPKQLRVLVDVKHSEAHQPVQVWIESENYAI